MRCCFAQQKKIFVIYYLMSVSSSIIFAQNMVDYRMFIDSAQTHSILYRGEFPPSYEKKGVHDRSTYFAYSVNFEKGNVIFRGKRYSDIYLNLDAHTDELYLREPVGGTYLLANKDLVDYFSVGSHKFIHYRQTKNSLLKNGYYEILYEGDAKLYKKIWKEYREEAVRHFIQGSFILSERFYLWRDNNWHAVDKKSDLLKLYAEQKILINNLLKTKKINFKRDKEYALIEILTYLDNL